MKAEAATPITAPAIGKLREPPAWIVAKDAQDPLAAMRDRFSLPPGQVYLDGNSLGALPAATPTRLAEVVKGQWGRDLISSWTAHDWIDAPLRIGDKIARLIGARAGEVIAADSTSVNLFKLLAAAVVAQDGRTKILSEPGNFPTDLYIAQGVSGLFPGHTLQLAKADGLLDAIDTDTAVVLLTHVHYKTGARFDMAATTAAAHAKGALVLWDLSHSVGAVEVDLNGCGADLAVGCGYKHLNGGPGAPAFLFVAERLQHRLRSPLCGWMGHAEPFAFSDDYAPGKGVARFACGTPPIPGLAALEVGVDLMLEADPTARDAKSHALGQTFIALVEAACAEFGLRLASPRAPQDRGSHVSFAHPDAYAVCRALIDRGVVGDFREPDILRFGLTPLYTRFTDVWAAAQILAEVLANRAWDQPAYRTRAAVT